MATPSGFSNSGYPPPPPPPMVVKRKTSPWVWVLVGLGALLLLVVVTLGGLVWFGVHKAKQAGLDTALLQKNPGLAAVKLMAAANPDIEIVSTDDDRGIVTIRNKKEGKLYTVNLEDAKNGRISLQEDGKPATTITANQGGQTGVTVQSSDGSTTTFGTGGKVPAWVPTYPGSHPEGTFSASGSDGSMGNFTFKTSDSTDKAIAFYEEQLKSAGFKVTTSSTDEVGGKKAGMVRGDDEAKNRNVTAIVGTDDGQTVVNLTVTEKK